MRLSLALTLIAATVSSGAAFAPQTFVRSSTALQSTVEAPSAADITARLEQQMEKLKAKDSASKTIAKEELNVVYEDDHIVVVNKPSGVLCVPGKEDNAALSKTVFEAYGAEGMENKMVVHRLGMDTSGLVVFARTMDAVRGMNTLFRTRKVNRQYEALLCGHVEADSGSIDLPLMRDYEFPPYMRVSTDDHQRALIDLDPDVVGKKLLEQPKPSTTNYEVVAREELGGQPVTRVSLTSISGRTHQLNVHCAAFGHPIVADSTYGLDGEAAPNGGLTDAELDELIPNASRASAELQKQIADAAGDKTMCVHAKSISFVHPVTKEEVSLSCDASF
mmetsp:Transcript_27620/g.38856  ORF Transcript_27620/g.38856 Transcript_27620/m.38856 type:complete len:334 (+) Transcript_27620:141-1142(+)